MIDVTDLYDAFHRIAQQIWTDFADAVNDESWDNIIDQLELDLFCVACAHRVFARTGVEIEPDDVPHRIRLEPADASVASIDTAATEYHAHAFYPDPDHGTIPNAVLAGNLMPRPRADVRLVITEPRRKRARRSGLLPRIE